MNRAPVIIGIGNPSRGDDGAGRAVLARLRGRLGATATLIEHDGEVTGLLALLQGARHVTLIDACLSGAPPGTILRLDAARPLSAAVRTHSTHGLGLGPAVEVARALHTLPPRCIVYLVEGAAFGLGVCLSAPVQAAVERLAARLLGELPRRRSRDGRLMP